MDRMTTRDINGSAIFLHDKWYAALLERLAAYEDTGLDPEEIRRYQNAETEGRLLKLPCKIGDTVFVLVKERKIEKYIVSGIIVDPNNIFIDTKEIDNPYGGGLLNSLQFGIDVFLSREEAEAALKQEVTSNG